MNDQERNELRVKVAKFFGWKFEPHGGYVVVVTPKGKTVMRYYPQGDNEDISERLNLAGIPDYPNDLNACHEFEEDVPIEYWDILSDITGAGGMSVSLQQYKRLGHATAEQRCCAFVATMEKGEHHGR